MVYVASNHKSRKRLEFRAPYEVHYSKTSHLLQPRNRVRIAMIVSDEVPVSALFCSALYMNPGYDRASKVAAAQVVLGREESVRELLEELGIKDSVLRRWAYELEEMGEAAFPGNGSPKVDKDYEIVKLRKQVEELEAENELLKKFPGLLESRPCVRYRFLKEHRGEFGPIRKACEVLGVSKSGYFEFLHRKKSNQQIGREALEGFVEEAFKAHNGRYGYRRVNRELRKSGIVVSEKRVLGVIRKLGLVTKGAARRWRLHRAAEPGNPRVSLVDWAFTVAAKNML